MPDIDFIAARLKLASAAYYGGQGPIMSDAEYDALEDSLRKLDPNHPVLALVGAPPTTGNWPKVQHPIGMGSLNKAQVAEEYSAWHTKNAVGHDLCITEKLDGISVLLSYVDGKLVRGATRGDGVEGQDITRNVRVMQGVPLTIAQDGTVYIKGEIICRKSDFAAYFQGESNPRNTASGTATCQTGWQKCRHLTVLCYHLTCDNQPGNRSGELRMLEALGFETPNWWVVPTPPKDSTPTVEDLRNRYIAGEREKLDYLIDGLVIEINNSVARGLQGEHNLRPKGAIAYKFEHDEKPTTLRGIVWQVGNSGRVTPVAEFDAVELAGVQVSRASLHNVSYIRELCGALGEGNLCAGDEILVSRRNDVIPYVESLLTSNSSSPNFFLTPTQCPSCSHPLAMEGEYLMCKGDDCPAQVIGSLKRWVSKVDILHLGKALLVALVESGQVETIGDLYRLDEAEFAALTMGGRRVGGMAKRAMKSLDEKRELTLDLFVGSLGIPLVGRKMTLLLMKAGIDDLNKMSLATVAEMASVPGFGAGRAASFREGFDSRKDLIVDIMAAGVKIAKPVEAPASTGDEMKGQVVCFTGVRDKEAEAEIIAQGGEVKGMSRKVTILVLKDTSSTSSKAKKARAQGTEMITLETLWERLGGQG